MPIHTDLCEIFCLLDQATTVISPAEWGVAILGKPLVVRMSQADERPELWLHIGVSEDYPRCCPHLTLLNNKFVKHPAVSDRFHGLDQSSDWTPYLALWRLFGAISDQLSAASAAEIMGGRFICRPGKWRNDFAGWENVDVARWSVPEHARQEGGAHDGAICGIGEREHSSSLRQQGGENAQAACDRLSVLRAAVDAPRSESQTVRASVRSCGCMSAVRALTPMRARTCGCSTGISSSIQRTREAECSLQLPIMAMDPAYGVPRIPSAAS